MGRPLIEITRTEALVICSGALALVPGVRFVWAWPWLWFVPGYFLAKRVLGARGRTLAVLAPALSIATATVLCLPGVVLGGRPRPVVLVLSVALFALFCSWRGARFVVRFPNMAFPPRAYVAALAIYAAVRAARLLLPYDLAGSDDAYFVGMVQSLGLSFPPVNYAACASTLRQPWGYWMLYALTRALSHAEIATTLAVASACIAITFLVLHYAIVAVATRDRVAASLTLPLSIGAFETPWVVALVRTGALSHEHVGYGDQISYGRWLDAAFYDTPALLVGQVVLFFLLVHAVRGDRRAVAVAAALFGLMPFFHPVHSFVFGLVLGLACAFEAGRRRLVREHALFLIAPAPFLILHAKFAPTMPVRLPFEVVTSHWMHEVTHLHLTRAVDFAGLLLLVAPFGVFRAGLTRRVLLGLLFATPLAIYIFTTNFANNYHWTFDWMMVAGVTLAAAAFGGFVRRFARVGWAACALFVALEVVGDHREISHAWAPDAPEVAVGAWVRMHTPVDAAFAISEDDRALQQAVLGVGERRLLVGPFYLLVPTSPFQEIDAWSRANRTILADPCAHEAARYRIDYVAIGPGSANDAARAAWISRAPPLYAADGFTVHATPKDCAATADRSNL